MGGYTKIDKKLRTTVWTAEPPTAKYAQQLIDDADTFDPKLPDDHPQNQPAMLAFEEILKVLRDDPKAGNMDHAEGKNLLTTWYGRGAWKKFQGWG